jgi:type I restriction enzyme M protein
LKDESIEDPEELDDPEDLATEAITELDSVVDDLRDVVLQLERSKSGR